MHWSAYSLLAVQMLLTCSTVDCAPECIFPAGRAIATGLSAQILTLAFDSFFGRALSPFTYHVPACHAFLGHSWNWSPTHYGRSHACPLTLRNPAQQSFCPAHYHSGPIPAQHMHVHQASTLQNLKPMHGVQCPFHSPAYLRPTWSSPAHQFHVRLHSLAISRN